MRKVRLQPAAWWQAARPFLPDPDAARQLWRDWRARKRPIVLRPYVDLHSRWRLAARFLVPAGVGLFCIVYGFFFAITAPFLIVPLAVPIAILSLLAIWALPENNVVPTKAMEFAFAASIIGLILWPNYLALTLPGLPWITMIRLTGFPMAFFLLISLSMSPTFRHHIVETASATPLAFRAFLLFTANEFVSLPFTHNFGDSINKIILMQLNWTCVFLICLYIFRKPGRAERYLRLMLALTLTIIVLSIWEAEVQKVLWSGSVPSFLRVEDPSAQRALAGAVRGATGQYRTKSTFATALGLSEFISLMTPFALHWAVGRYSMLMRLTGLALIPTLYFVIRLTDSRLGVVGYLVSCMIYLLLWSLVRWRRRMGDILTAAVVYAYPSMFLAAVAATMFVHKIHVLVFGGGSTAASNEARGNQFRMAIPALLKNPIGHGAGQSGLAMGYGAGDFIAIDSYYINIGLDFGIVGLVLYVAMFAMVIGAAVTTILRSPQTNDREAGLLLPLATCICAFLVLRGVFGEPDMHPVIFMMVGMVMALVSRIRAQTAQATPAPASPKPLSAAPRGPRRAPRRA
ncbi:O-antigen ligase family protein [Phenylobacterium sp.]|uniref:O-antigen ligase family protein n=1 Tax=Phenylobacterium sp. TaxID=1871053 RepID=UPI00356A4578